MVSKLLLFLLPLIINLYLSFATNKSSDLNYNEIQGTFYSSSQEFNFEIDSINASALLKYGFDPEKETKILVHGWVMDGHYFAQQFANAYHKYHPGKFNVIGINWKKLANSDNYFQACINSNQVGIYLGEHFISQLLVKQLGSKPENIHAIGHSLGAHLVGLLGRTVHEKTGEKLARITGLDPAKPYFDLVSKDQRLQNTDATLVDVIHSNSGFIWEGGLSMPEPMGTIDFYPNGGLHQPGCAEFCLGSACIDIDVIDLLMFGGCAHNRAYLYFVESIANPQDSFLSRYCMSYEDFVDNKCNGNLPMIPMGEGLKTKLPPDCISPTRNQPPHIHTDQYLPSDDDKEQQIYQMFVKKTFITK